MSADDTLTAIRAKAAADEPRATRAAWIAEAIRASGGYRWVGIYDVSETEVAIVAWSGAGPPAYPRFPRTRGLTARAVESAATVVVDDVASDPDYLEAFGDTKSETIVPVVVAGRVVGTIDVESGEPGAFADADVRFLERCRDEARPLWSRDQVMTHH